LAGVNKGAVLIRKTPPILSMLTYVPNEKKREKYEKYKKKENKRQTDKEKEQER
jgi:hypothetical protein